MRLESYAQDLEDIVLYTVLRDVEKGFYIDVGANDPTVFSVTRFFYDRGWNGINIEPLRDKCILLEELRKRDINLCVGIGKQAGLATIYTRGMLSSFNSDVAEELGFSKANKYEKKMMTLSEVYTRFIPKGQKVHFCKIDVEGYEKECLQSINNWNEVRPWIFAIESTKPTTEIPCYEEWENILLDNGYLFAYSRGINRYYIDREKEHLIQRFEEVNNIISNNEVLKIKCETISGKEVF